jgi:hypothetical protein
VNETAAAASRASGSCRPIRERTSFSSAGQGTVSLGTTFFAYSHDGSYLTVRNPCLPIKSLQPFPCFSRHPSCSEMRCFMTKHLGRFAGDRRLVPRLNMKIRLRARILGSTSPERRAESENPSRGGVFFATDLQLKKGAKVELLLKMPREITGVQAIEVCISAGHEADCRRGVRGALRQHKPNGDSSRPLESGRESAASGFSSPHGSG